MYANNVICPTCGAGIGRPCTNAWGYSIAGFHQSRIDAASGPRR